MQRVEQSVHRAISKFAWLILFVGSAAWGTSTDVGSAQDKCTIAKDHARAIISERLGIQVTVVEPHQINVRAHMQQLRGGLAVVLVAGPLAKAADLRLGDVIVKIDDSEVSTLGTALDALQKADNTDEKTQLTVARGGKLVTRTIMVGPSIQQAHTGPVAAKLTDDEPSVQQYRAKCQLLNDEQQEFARLEKVNEIQKVRLPALLRKREFYEFQAAQWQQRIDNAPVGDRRDALAAQQQDFKDKVEAIQKQILNYRDDRIPEQIQFRKTHLRVLEQGLEKSILDLRLARRAQRELN